MSLPKALRESLRAAFRLASIFGLLACSAPADERPAPPLPAPEPTVAADPTPPPVAAGDDDPDLIPAPRPEGPSCDVPELGQCTEYPVGHSASDPRGRCAEVLGYWRETPCAREGALGLCLIDHGPDAGAVRVVTMPMYGGRVCRIAGGRFAQIVGDGLRVDAPPPSYELAVAPGWTPAPPWLPLQAEDLTNVLYLRAPAQSDGTQPSLSIQRRALPEGATLESVVEERRAALTADRQTTIVGTEDITLGDRPATSIQIRVEDLQRFRADLGGHRALVQWAVYEAKEVLTVIDGQAWTLVCAGSQSSRRAWRRACDAMIASLRLTPSTPGQ